MGSRELGASSHRIAFSTGHFLSSRYELRLILGCLLVCIVMMCPPSLPDLIPPELCAASTLLVAFDPSETITSQT